MKIHSAFAMGLLVSLSGTAASGQSVGPVRPTQVHVSIQPDANEGHASWVHAAPAQAQLVVDSDGQTYVGVWVDAPNVQVPAARRAPLDLALVIDNSGSMAGDKIENARAAASSLLESLADGDIVSIYAFSNAVIEISPPVVVSSASRGDLIQRVSTIAPMGGTNMYDGLRVGESRLAEAPATHAIRRLVLISDGMANIGPSSPEELGNIAAGGTESGAQVSAIGVGMQYDERTLGALVSRSNGRLYHLDEPSQMAAILRSELNLLDSTVATDSYIDVDPGPGIDLIEAESGVSQRENGHLRIPIGALHAGQHREVLVRVRVPTTALGSRAIGQAQFVYRDATGAHARHVESVPLNVAITRDQAVAARSRDTRIAAMVANYDATQAQLRAAQMLNHGAREEAARTLADADQQVRAAAAAAPADVRERLMARSRALSSGAGAAAAASTPAAGRAAALHINAAAY